MPNGWKGKLERIEGIGTVYAGELKKSGVGSIDALLKKGATRTGRVEMAAATGLSETRILAWVNRADLRQDSNLHLPLCTYTLEACAITKA